nr:putative coenzyme F420-dependent oxidoreductase Rv3520c [Nerophis lumbriciformis]
MKLSSSLGFFSGDPDQLTRHVQSLESAGVDRIWGGEAYGFDLATPLAYLAGQTTTIELMSGIFPVYSRTPALLAATAASIDALSQGRFVLGLGTSGPQVIEGWHGVPFEKPLGRTRDVIEICRKVWSGDRVEHDGRAVQMPLADGGTGLGKPLKFMGRPYRADIPIVVAAIGPKNVAMTAELAEGWQPIHFVPDYFRRVWGDALDDGLAKRDPSLGPLEIIVGGMVALGEGPHVDAARDEARGQIAFYVGGMGAKTKNFYNDLFRRYGWEDEAEEIQNRFLSGDRQGAVAAVPEEYLDLTVLSGDERRVRERLDVYREAGVTHFDIRAAGDDTLGTIEKVKAWIE